MDSDDISIAQIRVPCNFRQPTVTGARSNLSKKGPQIKNSAQHCFVILPTPALFAGSPLQPPHSAHSHGSECPPSFVSHCGTAPWSFWKLYNHKKTCPHNGGASELRVT